MTLRELFFSLGYKVDKSSEKKAEKSINDLKSLATKALGAIGVGISISGLANLAQAAADLQATASQFKQVFGDLETEASNALDKIAKDTGVTTNRMKGSFTQIAAFAKTTGMETGDALALTERAMAAVADSAAFYDRSLEATTESLRSFLKGNFENDAALGLSATETTRNAAAVELYGKAFKDLSEQQKQLTLLKMVEDANKASGALGQAARESDTWTNQLGNMKQSIKDLKSAAGSTFLKPAVEVLKFISELLQKATSKVNEMSGTLEEKANIISRKLKEVGSFLALVGDKINKVAKFFGGWGNMLKLLTAGITAVIVALKWKKIMDGIKMIKAAFNPMTFKLLAIAAVVMLLVAIVDDFINFMKGNDSVLGSLFEKAGINADEVREKIKEVWENIKSTLSVVWEWIKTVAKSVFEGLQQFWNQWGGTITQFFADLWNTISSLIDPFLNALNGLLNFIKGVFSGDWSQAWEGLKQLFSGVIDFIVNLIGGLWTTLTNLASDLFGPILERIKSGFDSVVEWFKGLPDMAKQWMADFVNGLIDGIKEKISGFVDTVKGIGEEIASFLHFSVPDKGPLTDYESWMPDFMQGMAKGIKNNMPLIKNAVKGASELLANMGGVSLDGKTALNAIGGNTKTNNVNQTNEYNIQVTGTDPQAVNRAANTIRDAGGDNTSSLADALAYGL